MDPSADPRDAGWHIGREKQAMKFDAVCGHCRNARAFLTTTAKRLAINVKQSARARRETCVGPCLPEAVDTGPDPRSRAERDEALASGARLLFETLTPTERAAYVLREAFDYAYREIATALRLGEANARQVVTRARQHVVTGQVRSHEALACPVIAS